MYIDQGIIVGNVNLASKRDCKHGAIIKIYWVIIKQGSVAPKRTRGPINQY